MKVLNLIAIFAGVAIADNTFPNQPTTVTDRYNIPNPDPNVNPQTTAYLNFLSSAMQQLFPNGLYNAGDSGSLFDPFGIFQQFQPRPTPKSCNAEFWNSRLNGTTRVGTNTYSLGDSQITAVSRAVLSPCQPMTKNLDPTRLVFYFKDDRCTQFESAACN